MKVVIAGSRTIGESDEAYQILLDAIETSGYTISEVVCGMARGPDMLGFRYGREEMISVKEMPANWNKLGKKAGPIRNAEMAKIADAAIILWDGESKGSLNMALNMQKLGKPAVVVKVDMAKLPQPEIVNRTGL